MDIDMDVETGETWSEQDADTRQTLAAYLRYALDDVARIDDASASLLRLAIDYLEGRAPNGATSSRQ